MMVPAAVVERTLADLSAQIRAGRHRRRRRQLLLRRRHPPRQELKRQGHPLRRLRHQRRRVGTGARLLPDDRRRARSRETSRSDFRHAGAGRSIRRRARLAAKRLPRAPPSTAICIADPTAPGHFVKMVHNGIEYGLMAAYAEGLNILRHANVGKQQHVVDAETTPLRESGTVSVRFQSHRYRRGLAARQRHRLVAARSDGRRAGGRSRVEELRRPGLGFGRRALDGGRGDRRRGAGSGFDGCAVRALQFARRRRLRR